MIDINQTTIRIADGLSLKINPFGIPQSETLQCLPAPVGLIFQLAHNWPPLCWLALATRSKNLLNQLFFWLSLDLLEVLLLAMTLPFASEDIRFPTSGKVVTRENTLYV